MTDDNALSMSKRDLLTLIGRTAGASAMYMTMASLGQAQASTFKGPIKLDGDAKATSVLILGAGIAGMTAAYELGKAGYKVQLLDYNDRVGGRTWTLRGGDSYTELGGATQLCRFAPGNYFNPGPWRIPWHHHGLIHYCHEFGVALEPFMQLNYNAYVHSTKAFGGKPQRYRQIQADFQGHVSELLAKATDKGALADTLSKEDGEILLEALRSWGGLDRNMRYARGRESSSRRGWDKEAGGGLTGEPIPSEPLTAEAILRSGMWRSMLQHLHWDHETAIFQPAGGMDTIARGFEAAIGPHVRLNSKVVSLQQNEKGVTANYVDTKTGAKLTASADYCICTIPLPILAQIEVNVSPALAAAIRAVPYSAAVKVGIEYKRRFWEQDDKIYGGITTTDLPNTLINYPSHGFGAKGPAVLMAAYAEGTAGFEMTALSPEERVRRALDWSAQIHPQSQAEYMNGVAVAWHRVPGAMGCFGQWSDESRATHYKALCGLDGRIMLAGEHASYMAGWQEGAITSAIDAVTRLHQHVLAR